MKYVLAAGAVVLAAVVALNLTVASVGRSAVFPLSPFFMREKARALGYFAWHLTGCDHPDPRPLIRAAERKHALPRGLLKAVITVESDALPHRISFAGAMGLAQITPDTALRLGLDDPFDTTQAIDGSARYLAAELRRTKSARLAIAGYNAGAGNVRGVVPRNGETEHYVEKVMRAWGRR